MDKTIRQQEGNGISQDLEGTKDYADNMNKADCDSNDHITGSEGIYKSKQNRTNSKLSTNQRLQRTRSRSPQNLSNTKHWISSNAFINFVHDFRQNFTGARSTRILKLAGERWRQMSNKEKQPYLDAAKNVKNKKQDQKTNDTNKSNTNIAQKKTENIRRHKERSNSKDYKQNRKSEQNAESDSDTATSGTAGTLTSEDMSDASS